MVYCHCINNMISLIYVYLCCFFHSERVPNQIYSMNKLYTISSAVLFKITLKNVYIYILPTSQFPIGYSDYFNTRFSERKIILHV